MLRAVITTLAVLAMGCSDSKPAKTKTQTQTVAPKVVVDAQPVIPDAGVVVVGPHFEYLPATSWPPGEKKKFIASLKGTWVFEHGPQKGKLILDAAGNGLATLSNRFSDGWRTSTYKVKWSSPAQNRIHKVHLDDSRSVMAYIGRHKDRLFTTVNPGILLVPTGKEYVLWDFEKSTEIHYSVKRCKVIGSAGAEVNAKCTLRDTKLGQLFTARYTLPGLGAKKSLFYRVGPYYIHDQVMSVGEMRRRQSR